MSRTRVVSLCWGTAWERYGRRFADTFEKYWPAEVELLIVTDRPLVTDRAGQIMLQTVAGYRGFMNHWKQSRKGNGLEPPPGRRKDNEGYAWRFDAVKWAPQALAPQAGLKGLKDGDIFVWLDADVETFAPVPDGWMEGILGKHDVAFLGRPGTHPEIGFYALRVNPTTRRFLKRFSDFYTTHAVFGLPEWHSAYVWAWCLRKEPSLSTLNLTPPNCRVRKGHVWPHTVLAECTEHHKGNLKPR